MATIDDLHDALSVSSGNAINWYDTSTPLTDLTYRQEQHDKDIDTLKNWMMAETYKSDHLEADVSIMKDQINEIMRKLNKPGEIALQALDKLKEFINIHREKVTLADGSTKMVLSYGAMFGAIDKLRRIINGDHNEDL